ncbi:MAG TPA: T9SS type A sorting domain-containing protein [Flavobacteriales bacterium]|nr:T9SS type A sorting domain-containing protein [Flavobacteriales bacterium]
MKNVLLTALFLISIVNLCVSQHKIDFKPVSNARIKKDGPHMRSASHQMYMSYYNLWDYYGSGASAPLVNYAWMMNSRTVMASPSYHHLSSIGFMLDTLIDYDYAMSFPNTSYKVDSLKLYFLHCNFSGTNDTIVVRIMDADETTHFPTSTVLWSDTIITNVPLSPSNWWLESLPPTVFVPSLHINGDAFVDIHYYGSTLDTFGVIMSPAPCFGSVPACTENNFLGKLYRQHYPGTTHYLPDITGYDSAWYDYNGNSVYDLGSCEASLWTLLPAELTITVQTTTVEGKVYNDLNSNSLFDGADYGIEGVMISIPGSHAMTNSNGDYSLLADTGSISPLINLPLFYSSITLPGTITHTYYGQVTTGADFGITASSVMNDLNVLATTWGPPVPGMQRYTSITVFNNGTTIQNPVVKYLPDPTLVFMSSVPAPSGFSGDTVIWNMAALNPFMHQDILVLDSTPVAGTLGDTVYFHVSVTPSAGDYTPVDNIYNYDNIVVGSYDPNDKTPIPSGTGPQGLIPQDEASLDYTIRFQNTGTWYATNITIVDTISSMLDLTSMKILSGSHDYEVEICDNNVVKFHFYNIMLPDSNMNEPLSHGFIRYKINLLPMLPFGTEIKNTAYIYFDFNEAIITNTTLNTIDSPTAINKIEINHVTCFPNPSNNLFNLKWGHVPAKSVSIFTIDGKPVKAVIEFNKTSALVKMSDKETGIYFIETVFEDGSKERIKVVLQR